MALGRILKEARLKRRLTASEVAAGTRMKVQTVEAIEKEDFSKIPAPLYCKGFIKLYADFLGLDPDPLILEYVSKYVDPKSPSLVPESHPETSAASPSPAEEGKEEEDLFSFASARKVAAEARRPKAISPLPDFSIVLSKYKKQAGDAATRAWEKTLDALSDARVYVNKKISGIKQAKAPTTYVKTKETKTRTDPLPYETSKSYLFNNPIVVASLAAAGFVILILIISAIIGPRRGSKKSVPSVPQKSSPPDLVIVLDPPEPYVE